MQDIFGSVRKSFAGGGAGGGASISAASIADRIGSRLRRSGSALGLGLGPHPKPPSPPLSPATAPPIRWRRGELIGRGAFGSVYLGMNLDSGELLAVKQVSIGTRDAHREQARANIQELEEEVKLLKNLSHPNIVRYLGTATEEDSLNILLEFVSGGSISSMLGNLGSFPEKVIRKYTKQLLQGLEYLHRNKIMHRDIKGANILVHDNGCIKLADFGASKQVAQLATITAAKSMKGTPYWMAPEVIVQSGHSFSADIWSVGCTVIEMATGKPPWSQQYQEVAALFHVGTTQSHPPIPDCLSSEAKDFLLKCLQREPNSRATAADLLQHPFVTKEYRDPHSLYRSSVVKPPIRTLPTTSFDKKMTSTTYPEKLWQMSTSNDMCHWDDKDDMCRLDDDDAFPVVGSSFNPMSEPCDDWTGQFNASLEQKTESQTFGDSGNGFRFPCDRVVEDVNEVTETKITAFLREKAGDLKKMQTPLFEFYNTLNVNNFPVANSCKENATNNSRLPSKSNRSPNKVLTGMAPTLHVDLVNNMSTENSSMRVSSSGLGNNRVLKEILSPRLNGWEAILQDNQQGPNSPSVPSRDWTNFCERKKKKWEEELDQYITIQREMKRQEGLGAKSPTAGVNRKRESSGFNSPAK